MAEEKKQEDKKAEEKKPVEKAEVRPAEKEKKKQEKKKHVAEKKPEEKAKHMMRVAGVILDGSLDIPRSLMRIKGIGPQVSKSLLNILKLDKKTKLETLNEEQIEEIENTITHLDKYLPNWMLNRKSDYETGKNIHLIGPELEFASREDINRHKKIKSYKGIRHSFGLRVRGQRTRTTGRKGVAIGVSRKKMLPAETKKEEKK